MSCKKETSIKNDGTNHDQKILLEYAKNFELSKTKKGYRLTLINGDASTIFYLDSLQKTLMTATNNTIKIPIRRSVITSTTHIPFMDALGELDRLIGFPDTDYISNPEAQQKVKEGKIKDVGTQGLLNQETLIELNPEIILTYNVGAETPTYHLLSQAGIAILNLGDWQEDHPLGRVEWIKLFGILFGKQKEAMTVYENIKHRYLELSQLVAPNSDKPTVISGAMYKDVWYAPGGNSWMAQFFKDAQADYVFKETSETGSLALSIETVLEKGKSAAFWIAPAQFVTYEELKSASPFYQYFTSYQKRKIFGYGNKKGISGGLLFFEDAALHPDKVLEDLIGILHPQSVKSPSSHFFEPLNP